MPGLAINPAGTHLYVVESTLPGISRVPIVNGQPGPREIVVMLPGTVPDGIAFDEQGGLFISCYRPDRVYYLTCNKKLRQAADDFQGTQLAAPTNVAFAPHTSDLYVANFARWHISAIETESEGMLLRYPSTFWGWGVDSRDLPLSN